MNFLGLADGYEVYANKGEKITWITNRCINGIENCLDGGIQYDIIPENWDDKQKLIDVLERSLPYYKRKIFNYTYKCLNEYHNVNLDKEEWKIILSAWIDSFVGTYYEKYCKLKNIQSNDIAFRTIAITLKSEHQNVISDFIEYTELLNSDIYVAYQYSELINFFKSEKIIVTQRIDTNVNEIDTNNSGSKSESKVEYLNSLIERLLRFRYKTVGYCLYLPESTMKSIKLKAPFKVKFISNTYGELRKDIKNCSVDWQFRNDSMVIDDKDEFMIFLVKQLKKDIPKAYLEAFKYIRYKALNNCEFFLNADRILYTPGMVVSDEKSKHILARLKSKDCTLIEMQHGGVYGMEKHTGIETEYELCDFFANWGWKSDKKNFVMPYLKTEPQKYPNESYNYILYVGYSSAKYVHRLQYSSEYWILNLINEEISFFKTISSETKNDILIRPYSYDKFWKVKERISKAAGKIKYDCEKDFYNSLSKAKLVVTHMISTVFLEALIFDKPIIVILPLKYYLELDEAREDIADLLRVNVIVETGEQAGELVEAISDNICSWWEESERKKVVSRIREKYAYYSEDASEQWVDYIINYNKSRKG